MMMSPARPSMAPGVVARNVGGEVVLVPTRADIASFDRIFLLSRVGAFLWPLLDGTRDRDELCRLVRERFDVAAGVDIDKDVDAFVAELERRRLVAA
jgi:coenzyme PQQ synthesis protein D (PqqD)